MYLPRQSSSTETALITVLKHCTSRNQSITTKITQSKSPGLRHLQLLRHIIQHKSRMGRTVAIFIGYRSQTALDRVAPDVSLEIEVILNAPDAPIIVTLLPDLAVKFQFFFRSVGKPSLNRLQRSFQA